PDVLVATRGQLAAVFIPRRDDPTYLEQLLVRLALTRLALPEHARCALIAPSALQSEGLSEIARHFHRVAGARDLLRAEASISRALTDRAPSSGLERIPMTTR